MFEELNGAARLLLTQELKPAQGDRFQPTGFADLGPAVYETADHTRMLLVESAQSVANRMEAACLDAGGPDILPGLAGLPYVRAKLTGPVETVTTSLIEAHRINSPYIVTNAAFQKPFVEKSGYLKGRPVDWSKVAAAVFHFDPSSLLHGVFMANLGDGRVRLARAVSGFVEARDVSEVVSGGVKNNPLDPAGEIRAAGWDKNVYGNVPYSRTEFTAREIRAYFNVDVALLRSYRLGEAATELLVALALYKIRRFLSQGLRLRTACDFRTEGELVSQSPSAFVTPSEEDLLKVAQERIQACASAGAFADPPITELTTACVVKAEKTEKASAAAE